MVSISWPPGDVGGVVAAPALDDERPQLRARGVDGGGQAGGAGPEDDDAIVALGWAWRAVSGVAERPSIIRGMPDTSSIDVLLATLNATEVGSLDAIAEKMQQVQAGLEALGQAELAAAAAGAVAALRRGDVTEWKRARAFLQSKIGHLR